MCFGRKTCFCCTHCNTEAPVWIFAKQQLHYEMSCCILVCHWSTCFPENGERCQVQSYNQVHHLKRQNVIYQFSHCRNKKNRFYFEFFIKIKINCFYCSNSDISSSTHLSLKWTIRISKKHMTCNTQQTYFYTLNWTQMNKELLLCVCVHVYAWACGACVGKGSTYRCSQICW